MSYTSDMTAKIAVLFPSPEYNATMRAELLVFASDPALTSIPTNNPSPAEVDALIDAYIETTNYGDLPPDKYNLVQQLCQYGVSILWVGGVSGPSGKAIFQIFQNGLNAPVNKGTTINTIKLAGVVQVPAFGRNVAGEFTVGYAAGVLPAMPAPGEGAKCIAYMLNLQAGVMAIGAQTSATEITFSTLQLSTDTTVPGAAVPLDGTLADSLLQGGTELLVIEIYP